MNLSCVQNLCRLTAFLAASACSDVSAIMPEDEAPASARTNSGSSTAAPSQGLPTYKTTTSDLTQQGLIEGCTPGRICSDAPERQVASTGPATEEFFATGQARTANAQAQTNVANQRILLNNGKAQTVPGQRADLQRDQNALQQQELRLQRDRLTTAPYGQTIGSIYAQ